MNEKVIEFYCDGAASHNGYPDSIGGYGWVCRYKDATFDLYGGRSEGATNQQMELWAAISALNYASSLFDKQLISSDTQVVLYTDSAYLHNCYKQKWYVNWQKNGWVNSKKEPVANKHFWELLVPYFNHPQFTFVKVKGHSDNEYNNYADQIAVAARSMDVAEFRDYILRLLKETKE